MKKMLRLLSRISVRLMAFNVLLVFLPITAFLTLDTYEQQLLQALEHALVQQARILSSALSGQDPIFPDSAEKLLEQLRQRHEARLRVVDERGRLVADSSRLGPRLTVTDAVPADMETSVNAEPLYLADSFQLLVPCLPGTPNACGPDLHCLPNERHGYICALTPSM